jgi:hypothetical protein
MAAAAAASAGQAAWNMGVWLIGYNRKTMRESRTETVLRFLHELGCLNEADVRRLVEQSAPSLKITRQQRDELIVLLTNLVRGARFHTTCGTPISSYLRCERLIEQLLNNLQPHRHKAEPVGPGREEWVLERFLGMGAFGEVWLGRNPLFPEPRAFKFFTREGAREWVNA